LNLSSDEYDKSDDNDPTISEQDELQNATSLSSVPTKKRDLPVWQYLNINNPEPPFNVVENDEWQNMISKFDPRYRFSKRHTGANIANTIINILDKYDISKKTLALTTDNASSMVLCGAIVAEELEEGFNNFNFSHYHCAAHILNLAVS
ncbi:16192_t:CDS:2, partial [Gigaspora margarita]